MSFLNKVWEGFKSDMKAIPPDGIKIFSNDATGEFAFEIKNKPNRFVPTTVRHYSKGDIFILDASNKPTENNNDNIFAKLLAGNGDDKKCLEVKKQLE